jgi:hypothetical protein
MCDSKILANEKVNYGNVTMYDNDKELCDVINSDNLLYVKEYDQGREPKIRELSCDAIKPNSKLTVYTYDIKNDKGDNMGQTLCPLGGWCDNNDNIDRLQNNLILNIANEENNSIQTNFQLKNNKNEDIDISNLCYDGTQSSPIFTGENNGETQSTPIFTGENNDVTQSTSEFTDKDLDNYIQLLNKVTNLDFDKSSPEYVNNVREYIKIANETILQKIPQLQDIKTEQDLFKVIAQTVSEVQDKNILYTVTQAMSEAKEEIKKCNLNDIKGLTPNTINCDTIEKQNNFSFELCKFKNSINNNCIDPKNKLELELQQNLGSIQCNNIPKPIQTYRLISDNYILDCPIGDFCSISDNRNKLKNYMINNTGPDPRCPV